MQFETSPVAASAVAIARHRAFSWRAFAGKATSRFQGHALAMSDQAIVSASSFVSLMIIARYTNAQEVGSFALATSAFGILLLVQNALVATPIYFQRHNSDVPLDEWAFVGLAFSGFVCLIGLCALGAFSFILGPGTRGTLLATCVALPMLLLKEFVRDLAYADINVRRAFFLDSVTAGLQLSGLLVAAARDSLSATTALLVIAAAAGVTSAAALSRLHIVCPNGRLKGLLAETWGFGKWLVLARFSAAAQGYIGYWICFLFVGAATTGIYAACVSVASLANPFIFGLFNFFAPRSAAVLRDEGRLGLFRSAMSDAALMGTGLLAFPLGTLLFGSLLLDHAYPTLQAGSAGGLVALLTLASVISAVGFPASNGLTMLEKGSSVAGLAILAATATAALGCALIVHEGLTGVALAAVAGGAIATILRWAVFWRAIASERT